MKDQPGLGIVVVTGGCGFFGFHLVFALLRDPTCDSIIVLSRNPTINLHQNPKVFYKPCNITNASHLTSIFEKFQPRIIFHTAAPRANENLRKEEFYNTNINGTKIILQCARSVLSIRALVCTSSTSIYAGTSHMNLAESSPLCGDTSPPYNYTKAQADKMVREANSPAMRTVCLRVALLYGERDTSFVPGLLDASTRIQLGDNMNLIDSTSVSNAVQAHILAARILLDPVKREGVEGEAFNINDGNPVHFWDLTRIMWRAAGRSTSRYVVLPAWFALALAWVAEVICSVFTLGKKRPQSFNRLVVSYCVKDHTYSIVKAQRVLGYSPVVGLEEELRRSVSWELGNRREVCKYA
ncbi:hypothetical protein BGZ60DRAFT_391407 [Tricladium varicosporioides]|nr:hypothetical protein BGZ60DRAFT_391407 [Hymenoscyphus varicosporioides]